MKFIYSSRNQIIIILLMTILISLVSGVHRTLISLLYGLFNNNTNSIYEYTNTNRAPLIIWLQLAFTVAPFGLAKAATDYYAGRFTKTKKVLMIGIFFYLIGVISVSLLLFSPRDINLSQIMLPLSSGFIGAGEGFFYASIQILLSNYASGRQRGQFLGFSEFSIYGGYTIGSIVGGYLSSGNNFSAGSNYLFPYSFSFLVIILTILLNFTVLREYKTVIQKQTNGNLKDEEETEIEAEKSKRKAKFKPKKLVKNVRIFIVLLGAHFSKWGDALVLMLPIYFAYILSTGTNEIIPDTIRISILLSLYTSTWAIGMFFTSYLTEFVGRRFPIIFGLFLSGLGFLSLILFPRNNLFIFEYVSLSMMIAGLGTGFYYPLLPAIGLDIAKPKYQAQTLGLFRSIRDFGYFTGPIFLAILVWISGSTINNLVIASSFTGLLLITIAILFMFILRETRPSWPFFDEFVSHSYSIKKIVDKTNKVFDYKLIEKYKTDIITTNVKSANATEKKADKKKRELMRNLSISVRKTDDVADFIQLLKLIDDIGSKTSMAALKYSKLINHFQHIPKQLFTSLNDLSNCLPPMMDELLDTIALLDEEITLTVKKQKIISRGESITDDYYDEFLKNLYSYEFFYQENDKFTIMMTLKEVGENLEKASDLIQETGDLLTLIALKHRL